MIVRPYRAADIEGVLAAWEHASRLAHPFLTEDFLDAERERIPSLYIPNTDVWVAEVGGAVVGFIALAGNEVGAIFLDPACHGQGIGKALMDQAASLHATLEVEVFEANWVGRAFYDRYGFEFLERKKHGETGNMLLRLAYRPA